MQEREVRIAPEKNSREWREYQNKLADDPLATISYKQGNWIDTVESGGGFYAICIIEGEAKSVRLDRLRI